MDNVRAFGLVPNKTDSLALKFVLTKQTAASSSNISSHSPFHPTHTPAITKHDTTTTPRPRFFNINKRKHSQLLRLSLFVVVNLGWITLCWGEEIGFAIVVVFSLLAIVVVEEPTNHQTIVYAELLQSCTSFSCFSQVCAFPKDIFSDCNQI